MLVFAPRKDLVLFELLSEQINLWPFFRLKKKMELEKQKVLPEENSQHATDICHTSPVLERTHLFHTTVKLA